jgi:tetratricopeptide (TPR) repeat protein
MILRLLHLFIIIFFSLGITAQENSTFAEWKSRSQNDHRLLPKYGGKERSSSEIESDNAFKDGVLNQFSNEKEASDHMIDLGFQYLYRGAVDTAMFRFNQAYLLDEENSNIYWGYGGVYMALGEMNLAREQYDKGLELDKWNDNILTDYGTTYLGEYYSAAESDSLLAQQYLDKAIEKLNEAYSANSRNSNASYKLSICYLYKDNCSQALTFLELSDQVGNPNITEYYRADLAEKCRDKNIDCSVFRSGKFKLVDDLTGETIIERENDIQIETNTKLGYKLKLKLTWLDSCTYELIPIEDMLNPEGELPKLTLKCTITSVNENGYTQVSVSDEGYPKLKADIIRIE